MYKRNFKSFFIFVVEEMITEASWAVSVDLRTLLECNISIIMVASLWVIDLDICVCILVFKH